MKERIATDACLFYIDKSNVSEPFCQFISSKEITFYNLLMKYLLLSLFLFLAASVHAQRQTTLYIDDGTGNFLQLVSQALTGGGEILTFPNTAGAAANVLLSTSVSGQTIAGGLTVTGGLTSGAFTLPTATGASGNVITSDGLGGSSWQVSASFTPQLIDLYNTSTEAVSNASNIVFSTPGYSTGLTFSAGTTITVNVTGVYEIEFSLYTSTASARFEIFQNNTAVPATRIVCGANSLSHYSALMQATIGDVINLRNVSGSAATLSSPLIGDVNAAIIMKRVQ
jgi:BclA C-terminal domain